MAATTFLSQTAGPQRRSGGRQCDGGEIAHERKQEQKVGGEAAHLLG
ncbi:MAG: hypothetical protein WAM69_06950 [Candidatus Sulfotelmatobacter sp.]